MGTGLGGKGEGWVPLEAGGSRGATALSLGISWVQCRRSEARSHGHLVSALINAVISRWRESEDCSRSLQMHVDCKRYRFTQLINTRE